MQKWFVAADNLPVNEPPIPKETKEQQFSKTLKGGRRSHSRVIHEGESFAEH